MMQLWVTGLQRWPRQVSVAGVLATSLLLWQSVAFANPVAWYRFNAPNYGADAAGENHGSVGAATTVAGAQFDNGPVHGSALRFLPTNGVVEFSVPHSSELDITAADMTGMAWIRPMGSHTSDNMPGDCTQGTIMSKGGNYWFQIRQDNGAVDFQNTGGGELVSIVIPGGIPLNAWSHVAFVRTENEAMTGYTVKIYLNGTLRGEGDLQFDPASNTAPLSVGNYGFNGPGDCEFNGDIDDLKIFDVALGDAGVLAEFQRVAVVDVRERKSYTASAPAELQAFVDACLALKQVDPGATNPNLLGYDDFVKMHGTFTTGAHRGPSFLAWHRMFLLMFEDALRSVSAGAFANVTIPYWDWTVEAFPSALVGGDGNSAGIVTTGPFAYSTGNWNVLVEPAGGPELRRDFKGRLLTPVPFAPADVEAALQLNIFDTSPWNGSSADDHEFPVAPRETSS